MREQSNQRDWNNPKDHVLTIGVSTRALFDMEKEHEIFLEKGARAYVEYELAHERDVLAPGPAFRLIQAFLRLNETDRQSDRQGANGRRDSGAGRKDCMKENGEEPIRRTEVVIMSKNSAEASLRIFHSIEHYGLDIKKAALTTGAPIAPYLKAYHVDLYLSANEEDVRGALDCGVAAGLILRPEDRIALQRGSGEEISQIRIAFDGDAVLFSGGSGGGFSSGGRGGFLSQREGKGISAAGTGAFCEFSDGGFPASAPVSARGGADPHGSRDRQKCAGSRAGYSNAAELGRADRRGVFSGRHGEKAGAAGLWRPYLFR